MKTAKQLAMFGDYYLENEERHRRAVGRHHREPRFCPQCGAVISYKKRLNRFCNHSCAAGFINRHRLRNGKPPAPKRLSRQEREAIMRATLPFEQWGETLQRKIVRDEQEGCCGECGLFEWRSKPLTLELEHKDGNRENWKRENLIFLCPNCHSQTLTWRGRQLKGTVHRKRQINGMSLRQILKKSGKAAKGRNYATLERHFSANDLPLFNR